MPPKKKKDKLPAITQLPSGAYRTQIYLGKDPATGKKIVESFSDPDYQTVVRWAMDRMRDREQSAEIRATPGKMTLGEAIDAYIAVKSSVLSPSTIKNYKAFRRTGMQHLMSVPLQRISQSDLQAAINMEAATLAAKTVRNHYGVVTATMAMYMPNVRMNITLPKRQKPDICNKIVEVHEKSEDNEIEEDEEIKDPEDEEAEESEAPEPEQAIEEE